MSDISSILLSTAYLPPIEYFIWISKAKSILIEREEHYIKQTYRNRCEIYTANGKLSLTIPVIKTNGNHTRIKDIKIDYSEKWQQKHWRAIVSAYNQSPYFLYYNEGLEQFYTKKINYLIDYNSQLLNLILKFLKIESKEINFTDKFIKMTGNEVADYRYKMSPKINPETKLISYTQVFGVKHGFFNNLSIIDLIFNMGGESKRYISELPN
jgi:hypothetical protein